MGPPYAAATGNYEGENEHMIPLPRNKYQPDDQLDQSLNDSDILNITDVPTLIPQEIGQYKPK